MRVACYVVPDAQSHNLPSHGLEGVIFLVVSEWPYPKPRPRRCIGKHPQLGGDNTGGVAPVVHTPVTPKGGRNKKKTKGKKQKKMFK